MGLVTTTVFNTKISEVEKKIPDTSGFVSPTVLNTKIVLLENKISNFSNLAKKTDHNAKISGIKKKHYTTYDYNKITSEIHDAKINEKNQSVNLIFTI